MKENQTQTSWKSDFHDFNATFNEPWELIPSSSTNEKTLFGVIDKSDGTSYIAKITNDVPKDLLSDEDYYEAIKMQMLGANPENTFVNQDTVQFHGEAFVRQVYVMHTAQWGVLTQHAYTRRTGTLIYSVQASFPSKKKAAGSLYLNEKLQTLDQNIKVEGK